jgi:hypothetical protein
MLYNFYLKNIWLFYLIMKSIMIDKGKKNNFMERKIMRKEYDFSNAKKILMPKS